MSQLAGQRLWRRHASLERSCLLAATAALVLAVRGPLPASARVAAGCPQPHLDRAYVQRLERVLRSGRDVWGEALLRSQQGPTFAAIAGRLKPLLLVGKPAGTLADRLTDSGVYYVPLAQPAGDNGARSAALHVADGSQIVSERGDRARLTVFVGDGGERYGSCLARLERARLVDGFMPILETGYVDGSGASYRQESFTTRIPETRSQVSFVRLEVQTGAASARVRLLESVGGLRLAGGRLLRQGRTVAYAGAGGSLRGGSALVYEVPAQTTRTILLARLVTPTTSAALRLDDVRYARERASLLAYWQRRLAEGVQFVVPETRVLQAERSLLVQELLLTWRYSIGNDYQEYSFPETIDTAGVMGEYGFDAIERAILRGGFSRTGRIYPNLEIGEMLLGFGLHDERFRDSALLAAATPRLQLYLAYLRRQLDTNPHGILDRERYSSDLPDRVYGLNAQAVVWQGLLSMQRAWARTGHPALAAEAGALARRLGRGLRKAIDASEQRLPDGSLFLPVKLLGDETAYGNVTASRAGSYWNLVVPYALASGLIRPETREANAIFRYILGHGSRLLGLVRSAAFAVYRHPRPVFPTSGTNEVYGLNMARFLADNDLPSQLVLSFYGQLAAAMTPATHVAGEAASVAPVHREYYRRMYLPPNNTANAAWLEKLRLMLVHETRDASGRARGLELAFATPRAWLEPGKRIEVREAPTAFGPVSYTIESSRGSVRVRLTPPFRQPPASLRLRLRLPSGQRIATVRLGGRPYLRFSRVTGTIDLSGLRGELELTARL